jgi:hypothetical protein
MHALERSRRFGSVQVSDLRGGHRLPCDRHGRQGHGWPHGQHMDEDERCMQKLGELPGHSARVSAAGRTIDAAHDR